MAHVLGLARCTCTRTVFVMVSLGDARSVPYLAWTVGVMHRSRDGPRAWTRTLYLYPTGTVFGIDSLIDARSVHGCLGLLVHWCIFVSLRVCVYIRLCRGRSVCPGYVVNCTRRVVQLYARLCTQLTTKWVSNPG